MKYNKEYSSPSELIFILQSRGLDCSDIDNAIEILSSIGYYRLSGYFYPFLLTPKSEHIFKPGSTLGNALMLYEFDRELRQLVFNLLWMFYLTEQSNIASVCLWRVDENHRGHVLKWTQKLDGLITVSLSHSFSFKNCSESMDFTQVSFIPIQARSKVLWTYVQAPSGRTSLPPKDVRP